MNIKSISVLPSTKGYLAVTQNDLFVPEYIVLAVVEKNGETGLMPLAIRDIMTLKDVYDKKEFVAIPNDAVTNVVVQSISLHTAATYILSANKLNMDCEVKGLKLDLAKMAKEANVKYDERIAEIHSLEDCQKIVSRSFKKIMKNWRYWLVGVIAVLAFVNLIAVPQPHSSNYWLLVVYSKFTAVVLAYFDIRLFAWFAKHRKIDEIIEFVNEDK